MHERRLGFYCESAALKYGEKLAHQSQVEVWRETELIAKFERLTEPCDVS